MNKFKTVFLLLLIPTILIFGWGDKGHKLIAKHALELLPANLKLSDEIKLAIIEHSIDPDYRKKEDKTEPNKHFIDIDSYKEFLDGHMITSEDSLIKIYGQEKVDKEGRLPWATIDSYQKLVKAFKSKNKKDIILFSSDLAHYVGDGHQPLHACMNYNGQLTNQKGIHFRYEITMFDNNVSAIEDKLEKRIPVYINDRVNFIFDYITEANTYVDQLLGSDKFAYSNGGEKYESDYYRLLWYRTQYVTETEINEGSFALASLIYSAWMDAGKPDFKKL